MSLSYFYIEQFDPSQKQITLDEDTSYHVVQVLRMKPEEKLQLTDGKGNLATGHIIECHKKHCSVQIEETSYRQPAAGKVTIAISLVKNTSRFEWFLEKATEIGVAEIIPLLCERTVKEKFRYDRMKGIVISAMLQSQQCWLPVLYPPMTFQQCIEENKAEQKFIAHCEEATKTGLSHQQNNRSASSVILIGPEGDFSPKEIESALQHQFIPVTLGETRLRTETAGVAAAVLLKLN
ncbi:MAG: 16S rRNA (uracil(1498)-N(3))-methyltransferase [Chitinophagaceae bacterium]|nr:16S rRNA (uracil(1498)-N(3))-methyltransferase [Chitinophagaceae bacterium]